MSWSEAESGGARRTAPGGAPVRAAPARARARSIRLAASRRADAEGRPPAGPRHHLWCFVRQWSVTHASWLGLGALLLVMLALGREHDAWIVASALGLALLPAAIEGLVGVRLPRGFVLACGLYTVLTVMLGELTDFYDRLAWWDVAMHALSGFVVAGIGHAAALGLMRRDRARGGVLLPALFGLFLALGVAGLWELFEYALDARWAFSTQGGLPDTMHDIGQGGLGALLATGLATLHLRGSPSGPYGAWLEGAVADNADPAWARDDAACP